MAFSPTGYTRIPQDAQNGVRLGRRWLKPEAYPQGYVEDFEEPRTTGEVVFIILLSTPWETTRDIPSFPSSPSLIATGQVTRPDTPSPRRAVLSSAA